MWVDSPDCILLGLSLLKCAPNLFYPGVLEEAAKKGVIDVNCSDKPLSRIRHPLRDVLNCHMTAPRGSAVWWGAREGGDLLFRWPA